MNVFCPARVITPSTGPFHFSFNFFFFARTFFRTSVITCGTLHFSSFTSSFSSWSNDEPNAHKLYLRSDNDGTLLFRQINNCPYSIPTSVNYFLFSFFMLAESQTCDLVFAITYPASLLAAGLPFSL